MRNWVNATRPGGSVPTSSGAGPVTLAPPETCQASVDGGPLLAVDGLCKHFGGVRAVDKASFVVDGGGIIGLIGPNGAGKSTALKMIGGAIRPDGGTIEFDGAEVIGQPPHRLAGRGLVRTFQLGGEFSRLTVMENLLVALPRQRGEHLWTALRSRRAWVAEEEAGVERARALLARFELSEHENAYAGELSGGQRRLMEIMRAMMSSPRLLLLDEPMAGVNRGLGRHIEDALLELRADGLTMLMVEHELGCIERVCDRVVVMAQGHVIAEGTMDELRKRQEVLDAYLAG